MSCSCGSTICVCGEVCFCEEVNCQCIKCQLLKNICPRCGHAFFIVVIKKEDFRRSVCTCNRELSHQTRQLMFQLATSVNLKRLIHRSARGDICVRCNLPVSNAATNEDPARYCSCSQKTASSTNPEISTEHETSNNTSDHRKVSADRQLRKALSRKTRTEKSNWQAKKVKEHSSNSAEDYSNTETHDAELSVAETSDPCSVKDASEQNSFRIDPARRIIGDVQNLNTDSNTQSPTGLSLRTDDTSTGNVSLFVNTSRMSSPCNAKALSVLASLGLFQSNQNIRPNLPPPFPRLPAPVPGPSVCVRQLGEFRNLHLKKVLQQQNPFPQPAVAKEEKMEKWFETIQNVLNTSGGLPDAETAAELDKEDKKDLKGEEELDDKSEEYSGMHSRKISMRQPRYPLPFGKAQCYKSLIHTQNSGKDKDDHVPTSDTNRSTSLSKSHKESESD